MSQNQFDILKDKIESISDGYKQLCLPITKMERDHWFTPGIFADHNVCILYHDYISDPISRLYFQRGTGNTIYHGRNLDDVYSRDTRYFIILTDEPITGDPV